MFLDWRVSFNPGTGFVTLPDMQEISIVRGRRKASDPFQTETCTITSRNPGGWTTTPKVGDAILAYIYGYYIGASPSNVYNIMFQGYIRDVRINYGKLPVEDVVTIECEGLQGALGRAELVNYTTSSANVGLQYFDLMPELGLPTTWASSATKSIGSGLSSFNGNALDYTNALIETENGRLLSTPGSLTTLEMGTLNFLGRNTENIGPLYPPYFDDGTGTPPLPNFAFHYDQLEFRSQAEDYYNQVVVQPVGLAPQTATTGETPTISYVVNTYDSTTGQAQQLAQYLLQTVQNKNAVVKSISFYVDNQVNKADVIKFLWAGWTDLTQIAFRGDVYYVSIEGFTISAAADRMTRVTLFTTAGDANPYLRLDDDFYGRLDFGRLSF